MQIKSKGFAHLVLIIGVVLVGIVGIGYLVIKDSASINPIPQVYQQTDVDYWQCEQDSDCVIAINPEGCCYCPDSININYLGQNKWEKYEEGKTYTSGVECDLLCEQCVIPEKPVCVNNKCSFETRQQAFDLSTWKTYRNEEYGFEIRIPNNWIVEESTDYAKTQDFIFLGDPKYKDVSGDWMEAIISFPGSAESVIHTIGSQFTQRSVNQENVSFNGLRTLVVTVTTLEHSDWKDTRIFIEGDEYVYEINADRNEIIDQILSTFRFIDLH